MRYFFTKMHSLGNDFVMLNGVTRHLSLNEEIAQRIADRHFGIGCDQILVALPAEDDDSDFRFVILNSDGSESGQCGNGARCFARYLVDQGLTDKREIRVKTLTTPMTLVLNDDGSVTVDMGAPRFILEQIPFQAQAEAISYALATPSGELTISAVSMGNPHAVQVVDDVDTADVATLGPLVENHPRFPERANAGFMQILSRDHIRLRVHERGAGETLGCGSGSCAAVVSGIRLGLLDSTVTVSLPGGDAIVNWEGDSNAVYLTGSAENVFTGEMNL